MITSYIFLKLGLLKAPVMLRWACRRPCLLLHTQDKKNTPYKSFCLFQFTSAIMMEARTEDKAGSVRLVKPVRAAACETKQLSLFMSLSHCVSSSFCGCWVKLKVNLPFQWQQHCVNLPVHLKNSPRCTTSVRVLDVKRSFSRKD